MADLLDVETAQFLLLDDCPPPRLESVNLDDCVGRYAGEDMSAQLTQPPFDASAMDGYAVRRADLTTLPQDLRVTGVSSAGHPFEGEVEAGEAVRIFTGAMVPEGADLIVLQEDCEAQESGSVTVKGYDKEASFIRPLGYDFQAGDRLISKGARLSYRDACLLAAMNIADVTVSRRPRVAILATGDELVPPGSHLPLGKIVSSVPYGIKTMIEKAGGVAELLGIARDDRGDLQEKIHRAAGYDVLITIGGASVGEHDLVQAAFKEAGMRLNFWRIAMRPGKPMMVGQLGPQKVVGVPGNPVSALVCCYLFVLPLLRKMMGDIAPLPELRHARLLNAVPTNGPRQHYMRAKYSISRMGQVEIRVLDDQDSSLQHVLAEANALVIRQPKAIRAAEGEIVSFHKLDKL